MTYTPTANAAVPNSIPAYTVCPDTGLITYAKVKHVADNGEVTYFGDTWEAVAHCAAGGEAHRLIGNNHDEAALWVLFCRH